MSEQSLAALDTHSDTAHPSAQSAASSPEKQQIQELHAQLQSALEEIGKQRALIQSHSQASLAGNGAEPSVAEPNIWWPAWNGFRRGFVLAYSIRAGLGTMTRALALAKAGQYRDLRTWRLVSESGLKYREDAVRLGFFIGGFTGSYHLLSAALNRWHGDKPAQNCMAAGTAAGLTLLFLSKERRRTLALYMLARLAQCGYNSLKEQGQFHFWGSDWAYGDALLFALSSAQVMYAYVMRPETLPKSYWKFIVKSGPVEAPALEAVRRSMRGIPIDLKAFNVFLKSRGSSLLLKNALPKRIPDMMLHPQTASALKHSIKVPIATFRKTFPLYMSLSLVPYVVLNLKRALKAPLGTAAHAVGSAVQSTSFLSAFVGIYSAVISLQRRLVSWDSKLVYYVAEKKSRRSELALYVMPRAVDSFALGLMKRRWVPSVKFGEVLLFSLCMGGLMYFRQHEPQTMAPLLNTLISRIVFGETKKKKGDLPRPSSIAFSEGDFPGSYHQHSHSAVNSPDRGSSPQHLHSTSGPFQTTPPPPASLHSALNGNGQQLPSGTTAEDMLDDPAQQLSVTAGADVRDSEQIRAAVQSETKPDSRGHHVESQAQRLSHESSTSNSEQGIDSRAGPHHLDSSQGNRADSGVSEVRNGNDAATSGSHNGGGLGAEGSDPEVLQDDGVLSEQGVVEAETIVSSRDDLASLVQGTNELIGQLVSRNL